MVFGLCGLFGREYRRPDVEDRKLRHTEKGSKKCNTELATTADDDVVAVSARSENCGHGDAPPPLPHPQGCQRHPSYLPQPSSAGNPQPQPQPTALPPESHPSTAQPRQQPQPHPQQASAPAPYQPPPSPPLPLPPPPLTPPDPHHHQHHYLHQPQQPPQQLQQQQQSASPACHSQPLLLQPSSQLLQLPAPSVISLRSLLTEVQLQERLGAGAYGTTWKCRWRTTTVAIKLMVSTSVDELRCSTREAVCSRLVSHPCVVQCYAINIIRLSEQDLDPAPPITTLAVPLSPFPASPPAAAAAPLHYQQHQEQQHQEEEAPAAGAANVGDREGETTHGLTELQGPKTAHADVNSNPTNHRRSPGTAASTPASIPASVLLSATGLALEPMGCEDDDDGEDCCPGRPHHHHHQQQDQHQHQPHEQQQDEQQQQQWLPLPAGTPPLSTLSPSNSHGPSQATQSALLSLMAQTSYHSQPRPQPQPQELQQQMPYKPHSPLAASCGGGGGGSWEAGGALPARLSSLAWWVDASETLMLLEGDAAGEAAAEAEATLREELRRLGAAPGKYLTTIIMEWCEGGTLHDEFTSPLPAAGRLGPAAPPSAARSGLALSDVLRGTSAAQAQAVAATATAAAAASGKNAAGTVASTASIGHNAAQGQQEQQPHGLQEQQQHRRRQEHQQQHLHKLQSPPPPRQQQQQQHLRRFLSSPDNPPPPHAAEAATTATAFGGSAPSSSPDHYHPRLVPSTSDSAAVQQAANACPHLEQEPDTCYDRSSLPVALSPRPPPPLTNDHVGASSCCDGSGCGTCRCASCNGGSATAVTTRDGVGGSIGGERGARGIAGDGDKGNVAGVVSSGSCSTSGMGMVAGRSGNGIGGSSVVSSDTRGTAGGGGSGGGVTSTVSCGCHDIGNGGGGGGGVTSTVSCGCRGTTGGVRAPWTPVGSEATLWSPLSLSPSLSCSLPSPPAAHPQPQQRQQPWRQLAHHDHPPHPNQHSPTPPPTTPPLAAPAPALGYGSTNNAHIKDGGVNNNAVGGGGRGRDAALPYPGSSASSPWSTTWRATAAAGGVSTPPQAAWGAAVPPPASHVGGGGSSRMAVLLRCALEVAQGMAYLHSLGLAHGDLTPRNVLLRSTATSRRGYQCKISDFGLSHPAATGDSLPADTAKWGTLAYMAPEVLTGRSSCTANDAPSSGSVGSCGSSLKAADVYSFGAVLWHMCTGRPPFQELRPAQLLVGLATGELKLEWPPGTDPWVARIGTACMHPDPTLRPTFEEVVRMLLAEMGTRTRSAKRQVAEEAAAAAAAAAVNAAEASVGGCGCSGAGGQCCSSAGSRKGSAVAATMAATVGTALCSDTNIHQCPPQQQKRQHAGSRRWQPIAIQQSPPASQHHNHQRGGIGDEHLKEGQQEEGCRPKEYGASWGKWTPVQLPMLPRGKEHEEEEEVKTSQGLIDSLFIYEI
ncbi:hypothetical protein Agub_g14774 [Astrephomene gubernaculifera]|uniref:Protein kinase domain-containing protein n=1 Tax=Astrephomene gubernaculifera TaxID=47775 RepID=A0AAD3E212_9CHLO|nr:hypothetical protein Agub_g14774 [Astrephomene gubernaculifera]